MAITLLFRRTQTLTPHLRYFSTDHEFLSPNNYISSWAQPTSPIQAQAQLALLRRDYAKKVKLVRKEFIQEMEMLKAEKSRKDEAKKEVMRLENEARRAEKEKDKVKRAEQREAVDQEFRQTLLKERAQKLEYWKVRVEQVEEKKKKAKENVRNQSSMWTDEAELEKKINTAFTNFTNL